MKTVMSVIKDLRGDLGKMWHMGTETHIYTCADDECGYTTFCGESYEHSASVLVCSIAECNQIITEMSEGIY